MTDKGIESLADMVVKLGVLTYDLALLAGTVYLIQECKWSMWTFLLTVMFFVTSKNRKDTYES